MLGTLFRLARFYRHGGATRRRALARAFDKVLGDLFANPLGPLK